ncbi:PREDICTED: 25.3 kDa vesicle transport protein isoform X1 [Lupinus angustifolius]|uniref:25.3 kDa vesicle transport protein isoform X1 n=1 Tax=Lupinus angustifolius TaxID=3871 RepID=UPI00092E9AA7|nr:PREDICTED: 25.3 kDa vesicle transport protein isoform X1 [Lupinus angustifolius]
MVKVTIVGRVRDGFPIAQGLIYMNKGNVYLSYYMQQAEFMLQEISRGTLVASKMTILIDHYCFNYLVENGVVFIVLCVSTYPRKLAFHYLQDIQKEFEKFDKTLIDKITRPYSFVKFGSIIANITRQYIDTRTQANLSKLNASRKQDLDVVTEDMFSILQRRRNSETMERLQITPQPASSIWCSPLLEVIALKWTPIMIIVITSMALVWATIVLKDDFIVSS